MMIIMSHGNVVTSLNTPERCFCYNKIKNPRKIYRLRLKAFKGQDAEGSQEQKGSRNGPASPALKRIAEAHPILLILG